MLDSAAEEFAAVGRWLAECASQGVTPGEMAVFVRSSVELPRARAAVEAVGLPLALLDDDVKTSRDRVSVGVMP